MRRVVRSRRRNRWGDWELKRRIPRQGAGPGIGGRKRGRREWEQSKEKGGDGEIGGGRGEEEAAGGDGEMHRTALQREVLL